MSNVRATEKGAPDDSSSKNPVMQQDSSRSDPDSTSRDLSSSSNLSTPDPKSGRPTVVDASKPLHPPATVVVTETIKAVDEEIEAIDEGVQEETDVLTAADTDKSITAVSALLEKSPKKILSKGQTKDAARIETKSKSKTAAAAAFNDNPKAVETCIKLLKVIIGRFIKPSPSNSPPKQFGYEQIYLSAVELLQKIDAEILTHNDVKEILTNLIDFSQNKLEAEHENARTHFVQALVTLIMAVAELANLLEKLSGAATVDWVKKSTMLTASTESSQSHRPFSDYVIPIAELEKLELIGTGTFGNVYKVNYRSIWFALKIVPFSKFPAKYPSQVFVDKAVQAFSSDSMIGKMFCTFVVKPNCYVMLMDAGFYCCRRDLERVVAAARYIGTEGLQFIVLQIVCAVGYLHLNGFIHRDLCLSNILIDAVGHTRLIDFDSAKICRGHFWLTDLSKTYFQRTAMEFIEKLEPPSIAYTAPEILKGFSYGRASDWWSVGIVSYKCATGRLPFRTKAGEDLKQNIITMKYFWPADHRHSATKEAREFIYDLLRKKPTARLGSRSYADIHSHLFMEQCSNRLMTAEGEPNTKKSIFALKQEIFSTETLVDFYGILRSVEKLNHEEAGSVKFNELADEDQSKQQALYTYASPKFRKLFDRLKKDMNRKALRQLTSAFVISRTPPQEQVDYSRFAGTDIDPELTDNRSRSDTHMQRLAFDEKVSVSLQIKNHAIFFWRRVAVVELTLVVGDGGLFYPAVKSLGAAKPLDNSVVFGDLIAKVGGQRTGDLTLCNIRGLIHKASAGLTSIFVDVMARNIFRRIVDSQAEVRSFLNVVPRAVVSVPLFARREKALRTKWFRLDDHGSLYVVSHVAPKVRHKIQGSILFGDVILEVNGYDVRQIEDLDFAEIFLLDKTVILRIAEMSVLRRSDLRDAVLDKV